MRKNLKRFPFVLFFGVFYTIGIAQNSGNEGRIADEKLVSTILMLHECQSFGFFQILIPGKKTFDEKGRLTTQEFFIKGYTSDYGALGLKAKYFINITRDNGIITSVDITNTLRYDNYYKIVIQHGEIQNIGVVLSNFYFQFNTDQKLIRVNKSKDFDFYGHNEWKKHFYTFEYNASGVLQKIQFFVTLGSGADAQHITERYTYMQEERIYFANDPNKVRIIRYRNKIKKEDADEVDFDQTLEHKQSTGKEEFITTSSITGKEVCCRAATEFNNEGQVTRIVTFGANNLVLNDSQNEYDDQGFLVKTKCRVFSSEGAFVCNNDILFTYTLLQNSNPRDQRSYTSEMMYRDFNDRGELISEKKNHKIRKKKKNGEWEPWTLSY